MSPVTGKFVCVSVAESQGYGNTCYDCDEKGTENVPAVIALITNSDSFGSEYCPMCASCRDAYIIERDKAREEELANPTGHCDWCKASNVLVSPRRDFEEGSHGRVYDVCRPCIDKENELIRRDLYDGDEDWDDYY
mgnify:CR=1 FL=1